MQKKRDSTAVGQESQGRIKINVPKPGQGIPSNSLDLLIPRKRFLKLHV